MRHTRRNTMFLRIFYRKYFKSCQPITRFRSRPLTAIFIALNAGGNFFSGILHRAGVASWALICTASLGLVLLSPLALADATSIGLRLAASALLSFVSGFVPSSLFVAIPRLSAAPSVRTFINAGLVQASATGQLIGVPLVAFVVARSNSWLAATPPDLGRCWIDIFGRHGFAYIGHKNAGTVSFVTGVQRTLLV